MIKIQVAVINESTGLTDDQAPSSLSALKTQGHRDLSPVMSEPSKRILCCYVNATSKIQMARIANISNWYFERVVFPGQRLLFEALPEAQLEIHTGIMNTAILSDQVKCEHLRVALQ